MFRHTHDLSALIALLETTGYSFPDELRAIVALTRFAVEFRYDLFEDHSGFDRQAAVGLIGRLRAVVEREIERATP